MAKGLAAVMMRIWMELGGRREEEKEKGKLVIGERGCLVEEKGPAPLAEPNSPYP